MFRRFYPLVASAALVAAALFCGDWPTPWP